MKKGQRPSKHSRRVRTKYGRRRVKINPYIKKKSKRRGIRFKREKYPTTGKYKPGKEMDELLFALTKREGVKAEREMLFDRISTELKTKGKSKVDSIGILRLKKVPAKEGGKRKMMFGKEYITKYKPASIKIKFRPSKKLKEAI